MLDKHVSKKVNFKRLENLSNNFNVRVISRFY